MMSDEFTKQLKGFQLKADAELDRRVLQDIEQWKLEPVTRSRWSSLRWGKWAAVLVAGVLLLWSQTPHSVAWSQVADRFEAVPYVRVSLNLANERDGYSQHMDLWMGSQGRLRMHTQSQVIYAEQGKILRVVTPEGTAVAVPDEAARKVIEELGAWDTFSLSTVIQAVSQEPLVDVTPSDDLARSVWRDLVMFDSRSTVESGRIRLYALRNSKLPVSLRIHDTEDGLAVEAMFLYEKEPPASFFKP